jgi:DNA-binding transcriptional ArsR family regulator
MIQYQLSNLDELNSVSNLFKVLGHPKRLQLLYLLIQNSMTVSQISESLNWEQSAVSHQLQLLRKKHFVSSARHGKQVVYRLDNPVVMTLIADAVNSLKSENMKH